MDMKVKAILSVISGFLCGLMGYFVLLLLKEDGIVCVAWKKSPTLWTRSSRRI